MKWSYFISRHWISRFNALNFFRESRENNFKSLWASVTAQVPALLTGHVIHMLGILLEMKHKIEEIMRYNRNSLKRVNEGNNLETMAHFGTFQLCKKFVISLKASCLYFQKLFLLWSSLHVYLFILSLCFQNLFSLEKSALPLIHTLTTF